MAGTSGRKTSSSKKSNRNSTRKSSKHNTYQAEQDKELIHEIGLIIIFVVMVFLFLCNFGVIGPVGNQISGILFGIFGLTAYLAPVAVFLAIAFWFANAGNPNAVRKLIAGMVLFVMVGVVCDLFVNDVSSLEIYDVKALYERCSVNKNGGGVIAGSLTYLLGRYLEMLGTILVVLMCSAISLILLTEKSLLGSIRNSGSRLRERSRLEAETRREYTQEQSRETSREMRRDNSLKKRTEQEEAKKRREEEKRLRAEEKENEKILRMEKRVSGVILDTSLKKNGEEKNRDDIHEITLDAEGIRQNEEAVPAPVLDFEKIRIRTAHQVSLNDISGEAEEIIPAVNQIREVKPSESRIEGSEDVSAVLKPERKSKSVEADSNMVDIHKDIRQAEIRVPRKYVFPPVSRLKKGNSKLGGSTMELKDTAVRLQQTLNNFGVKVTITDISQGPSVTRYELQPEQGVKVSKIVNLADDIKLNLAAMDIRIEAPIPGKAAIGIEVPNKENIPVAFRDLVESKEFREFPSDLAFAVGKDIAGQVVVADIAKMPHMLIAGATGSGKSVCINTLIMSIIYKAHPDNVKMIMVDPKVVELNVYNGIPHLLIPVVTDPKKAASALHWGVAEMTDRYKKFADYNVRDLKGYNKKVESLRQEGEEDAPAMMPQVVIIVDELADLMMVSPGEVEESICRLAQLARAAGIHLIIATQRPSVDVITGLIKANMPSRLAFSVSSGVDSRTILDMNGAEKLLGKGDMLFYPQGYAKPARIQGAFVSDKEVSDVVDFLKNQALDNVYAEDIEEQIRSLGGSSGLSSSPGGDDRDEYFADAGRFVIEKDKASIGMLQRVFKIGFNRAARIMDQLCTYGVVGEEEGTKPRKVLMSEEQFQQLLEEI